VITEKKQQRENTTDRIAAITVLLDNVIDFCLMLLKMNAESPNTATNILELMFVGIKVNDTGKK